MQFEDEENGNYTAYNNSATSSQDSFLTSNDTDIIVGTVRLYGSLYIFFFIVFCIARKAFPKLFNLHSWVEESKTNLAIRQSQAYGLISWCWKVFQIENDNDVLLESIGLDGLCFLRVLRLGFKLSLCGALNGLYLIPLFLTASDSNDTYYLEDIFVRMSVSNIPRDSPRFAAVVFAAYMMLVVSLKLMTEEYDWFIDARHKYLSQRKPRNYTIYVSGIPRRLRSNADLADFFLNSSREASVLVEAHIVMDVPALESNVNKRINICERLEHEIALQRKTGIVKTHRIFNMPTKGGEKNISQKVKTIDTMMAELTSLNMGISSYIKKIRSKNVQLYGSPSRRRGHSVYFDSLSALPIDVEDETIIASEHLSGTKESSSFMCIREKIENGSNLNLPKLTENDTVETPSLHSCSIREDMMEKGQATLKVGRQDSLDDEKSTAFKQNDIKEDTLIGDVKSHAMKLEYLLRGSISAEDIIVFDDHANPNEQLPKVDIDHSIERYEISMPRRLEKMTKTESHQSIKSLASNDSKGQSRKAKAIAIGVHGAKKAAGSVNTVVKKSTKVARDALKGADLVVSKGMSKAKRAAELGVQNLQRAPELAMKVAGTAAAIAPMLRIKDEGAPREAGFVVFRDLYSTHAARQMIQYHKANRMMVEAAPDPEEIYWDNIGLTERARNTGLLLSVAATSALCVFWSIPVAFFSSMTELNSLKQTIPVVEDLINEHPSLENFFALLAPTLLLLLNKVILPFIVQNFSKWEGHISNSKLEAATFTKLVCFVIIQQFFVSTISGSISAEISNILANPQSILTLLANSLPAQSSYFIQILLVFTFLVQGLEMLRVVPLSTALARRIFGPRLTEKERKKTWKYLYSLEDPREFFHAETLSQIVLFFFMIFIYAPISPMTCVFLSLCFPLCEMGYRYNFIHNHKALPDSGGRLWKEFMNVLLASMIIGQLTLIGFLSLKNPIISVSTLAPMTAMTILHIIFVRPKKMHVSDYLPASKCTQLDDKYMDCDVSFLQGKYLQPALQHLELFPEEEL